MVMPQLGVHEVDQEDAGIGTTTLKTGQDWLAKCIGATQDRQK